MGETEFWVRLEYRVCSEFAEMHERHYRRFWCDGLLPSQYLLNDVTPRITGRCWIGKGPREMLECEFTLLLPGRFGSREEIDWLSLLPPENATRWMNFDENRKYIEFEPAVAVPDLDKPSASASDGPSGISNPPRR